MRIRTARRYGFTGIGLKPDVAVVNKQCVMMRHNKRKRGPMVNGEMGDMCYI